jgi:hypothetical protein
MEKCKRTRGKGTKRRRHMGKENLLNEGELPMTVAWLKKALEVKALKGKDTKGNGTLYCSLCIKIYCCVMFCLLHLYTARLPYELTWKSILDSSLYCDILLCSFVITGVFLQAPRNILLCVN